VRLRPPALSVQRVLQALLILTAVVGAVVLVARAAGVEPAELLEQARAIAQELAGVNPLVLLAVVATLPAVGMPITPVLIIGAAAYGPWTTFWLSLLGLSLNSALCFLIAKFSFHGFLVRYFERRGRAVPQVSPQNYVRFTIFVRLIAGMPLPLQNYLLTLAGVPLVAIILASLPVQAAVTLAIVLTAGSLFQGQAGLAILGGALALALVQAASMLRRRRLGRAGEEALKAEGK